MFFCSNLKDEDHLSTYAKIIKANTKIQATLLCGEAADAELLRPAILVLSQNS